MAATREDIERWFDQGAEKGAKWMLVVCDTYDHEDYPAYHHDKDKCKEAIARLRSGQESMQKLMECYDLTKGKAGQLSMRKCFAEPT